MLKFKDSEIAIGIDIGGSKIAAVLAQSDGNILLSKIIPTQPQDGIKLTTQRIAELINNLANQSPTNVMGVGIGCAGWIDGQRGKVMAASNLGWEDVPLLELIQSNIVSPIPICIEKDTNAALLGEYYFGAAQGCSDFIYLSIGTGLGGAVMTGGHLIRGGHGHGTEFGHLVLVPDGSECTCGLRGCAETIVSGRGLVNWTQRAISTLSNGALDKIKYSTPESIINEAKMGDPLALAAVQELGRNLGIVAATACSIFDPQKIIVAGSIGLNSLELFLPIMKSEMMKRIIPTDHANVPVVPSRMVSSALGSASLVWHKKVIDEDFGLTKM